MRRTARDDDAGMSQPPFNCTTPRPRKRLPMQDADATPDLAARPDIRPAAPDAPVADARPLAVLFIEDSVSDFALMQATLRRAGISFQPRRVETEQEMRDALGAQSWDAIISDYSLPTFNAESALELAQHHNADVPFLIVSGEIGEGAAVEAMLAGADDYIMKNNLRRLPPALKRSLRAAQTRRQRLHAEEQLRELSRHADRLREQERAELAREIHDDLGALVTRIRAELTMARRNSQEAETAQRLDVAEQLVASLGVAISRIARSMRPPVLDFGIVAAIEWQARDFAQRTGIPVNLNTNQDDLSLDLEQSTSLFRIFQEALTNIYKHADASRIDVELFADEHSLTLEVTDNGRGMSSDALRKQTSFGLRGMMERIRSLGGWMDIGAVQPTDRGDNASATGTTLMISIPLGADAFPAPRDDADAAGPDSSFLESNS